jgi:hypothetical protein
MALALSEYMEKATDHFIDFLNQKIAENEHRMNGYIALVAQEFESEHAALLDRLKAKLKSYEDSLKRNNAEMKEHCQNYFAELTEEIFKLNV